MIRLPPTSISLSESDIQFHLKQIDIYRSLLRQGFKRDDILRYYTADRSAAVQNPQQRPPEAHVQPEARVHVFDSEPVGSRTSGEGRDRDRDSLSHDQYRRHSAGSRTDLPLEQESPREGGGGAGQRIRLQTGQRAPTVGDEIIFQGQLHGNAGIAPSCVELRIRSQHATRLRSNTDCSTTYNKALRRFSHGTHEADLQAVPNIEDDRTTSSPPPDSHMNRSIRHRPRQSSMLHITRNADSPSSSGQSDDSFKSTVTEMPQADSPEFAKSPLTRTMKYRTRSQTYPWVQSEADDPKESVEPSPPIDSNTLSQQLHKELRTTSTEVRQVLISDVGSPLTQMRPISITQIDSSPAGSTIVTSNRRVATSTPLRPEAEDFIPLKLPPPFSATRRISSGRHSLPSSSRNASPNSVNYDIYSQSSPNLALSTPPRSSSLASLTRQLGSCFTSSSSKEFSSSPPRVQGPELSSLMGRSIQAPATPSHRRSQQVFQETRPCAKPKMPRTQLRIQETDGPGTVYNDRLPAHLQPKTPADLSRSFRLTDREAAYTAPPGRTPRAPATISQFNLSPISALEPGEESPSRRAHTIRERRNREFRRSILVEEERWSRARELEASTAGRGLPRDEPGPVLVNEWQDDLNADRVGEENFDEDGMTWAERGRAGQRHL